MAKRVCEWKGKRRAAHRGVQAGVLSPSVQRRNARSRSLLTVTPKLWNNGNTSTGPPTSTTLLYATRTRSHAHPVLQRNTRFTQGGDKAFEFTTQPRTLGRAARLALLAVPYAPADEARRVQLKPRQGRPDVHLTRYSHPICGGKNFHARVVASHCERPAFGREAESSDGLFVACGIFVNEDILHTPTCFKRRRRNQ